MLWCIDYYKVFISVVPELPSSQSGQLDNSEDDIFVDSLEDPNDDTYSPDSIDDSLKSSEAWSEQSTETQHVRQFHVYNWRLKCQDQDLF